MAPKTKVALHTKLYRPIPSVRRNPVVGSPETAGSPANSNSFAVLAVPPPFDGPSSSKDPPLCSIKQPHASSQRTLPSAAIPEEVTHKNSAGSDDSDEEESGSEFSENGSENGAKNSENDENDGENSGSDGSYESSDADAEKEGVNAANVGQSSSCEDSNDDADMSDAAADKDSDSDGDTAVHCGQQRGSREWAKTVVDSHVSVGNLALRRTASEPSFAVSSDALLGDSDSENGAEESGEEDDADKDSEADEVRALQEEITASANAETADGTAAVSSLAVHSEDASENRGAQKLSVANIAVVTAAVAGFCALRQALSPKPAVESAENRAANADLSGSAGINSVLESATHLDSCVVDAQHAQVGNSAVPVRNEHFAAITKGISDPIAAVAGLDAAANSSVATENDVGGKLDFVPVNIEEGKLLIAPNDDDISRCKKKWHECLVGYFVGSSLPENVVKEYAHRMWGKKGLIGTFVTSRGFFFFRFDSECARKKVLEMGPHFMFKHPIILQQYEEKMRLVKERQKQIAIWVKFFDIPVELMSYRGISLIASAVGKPLYLDEATKKMVTSSVDRFTFARVCVMADAERPLPNEMYVDYGDGEEHIKIEAKYEWRPPHCTICKVFGHSCDKRTVEKTVRETYADVTGKIPTPDGKDWPALNGTSTPQQLPTAQQGQSFAAVLQPSSSGQQHTAAVSGQQHSAAISGQQQTATPQQRSAMAQQSATPQQRSAMPQQRAATPKQRAATPQQRAATPEQRAATPHAQRQIGPHQLETHPGPPRQPATGPDSPQEPAARPELPSQQQQQNSHPNTAARPTLQHQISGAMNKEVDDGDWQKPKGKRRGKGPKKYATQEEGPRTRSRSRMRRS